MNTVQIVGMSATLPNLSDLSTWLGASLFTTTFRPVNLTMSLARQGVLYRLASDPHMTPPTPESSHPKWTEDFCRWRNIPGGYDCDEDGLASLVMESLLPRNKSVMVFCSSKQKCIDTAKLLTRALHSFAKRKSAEVQAYIHHCRHERKLLVEALGQTAAGLCPVLEISIQYGIAYHNASLMMDERKIIEEGFRAGYLSVLCTTSTLSAGVNLPAHRVIIRFTF